MNVLVLQGLLISPLVLFILIAIVMTIATTLVLPKSIRGYVIFSEYWLKLIMFICYMAISMLVFGAIL